MKNFLTPLAGASLLVTLAFGTLIPLRAENPFAVSHYVVERRVPDLTDAYAAKGAQLRQLLIDYAALEKRHRDAQRLASYVGQKFPVELTASADSFASFIEREPWPTKMRRDKAEKVSNDLAKGKLNKEAPFYLQLFTSGLHASLTDVKSQMRKVRNSISYLEGGALRSDGNHVAQVDGVKIVTVFDTVPNPLFNHRTLNRDSLAAQQKASQMERWEWVLTDELVPYEAHYPVEQKYHYFKNHPEYAVIDEYGRSRINGGNAIFDRDGKLVRVFNYTVNEVPDETNIWPIESFIYAIAYKKNAYGIQSAPKAVTHAIKVKAGLESKTAAEKAQDDKKADAWGNAFVESMEGRMKYGDSWVSDAIERRALRKASKVPVGLKVPVEASKWMRQVDQDYAPLLSHPYSVERVDGTNFKVTWVDESYTPRFEGLAHFYKSKPIGTSNTLAYDYDWVDFREVTGGESIVPKYPEKYVLATSPIAYEPDTYPGVWFLAPEIDKAATFVGPGTLEQFVTDNLSGDAPSGADGSIAWTLTIEPDGSVSDSETVFAMRTNEGMADAMMSLAAAMPKWQPAMRGGQPVRSRVTIELNITSDGHMEVRTANLASPAKSTPASQTVNNATTSAAPVGGIVYDVVDQNPSFPGGPAALLKQISDNLRAPEGERGKVVVRFVVLASGAIGEVEVTRSKSAALDAAAIEAVRSLPRFEPAKIGGKPVNCYYTLPITVR